MSFRSSRVAPRGAYRGTSPRNVPRYGTLDRLLPAAVFIAAFAYIAAFRRFGWFLEDEGVLYYQYLRVHQGQVPYRDFFTGYTPLTYYLHAWAFSFLGVSIQATRLLVAVAHAITAAGLYVVGRRVAPAGLALVPPALFLAMQPDDIIFAHVLHNSPYPTWYAITFAVLGTWALLRGCEAGSESRRRWWLFGAGVLGGLVLLTKQNAGVFFLWGVSGFVVSWNGPVPPSHTHEPRVLRALRIAYLGTIAGAAALMVRSYFGPATLVLFVLPAATLAAIAARRAFDAEAWRVLPMRLLSVSAGVVAVTTPWLVYFGVVMGLGDFLKVFLEVGANVERNLYESFPRPHLFTVLCLVPPIILATVGWLRGRVRPSPAAGRWSYAAPQGRYLAALSLAGLVIVLLTHASSPARPAASKQGFWKVYSFVGSGLDNLFAYGTALVLAAALLLAWRQAREPVDADQPRPEAFLCVLWVGACSLLVYYPRMDTTHLIGALPILYVVGAGLLVPARQHFAAALGPRRALLGRRTFDVTCAVVVGFLIVTKSFPKVYAAVGSPSDSRGVPMIEWLRLERAELYFPVYDSARQRQAAASFRDLVHHVRDTTGEGEPVFTFPALCMVNFLTGRDNPTRHDYFFGNNVSPREQQEIIRTLERRSVSTVVITRDPGNYFVRKSREYTAPLTSYLRRHYEVDRRFGSYEVLRRRAGRRS